LQLWIYLVGPLIGGIAAALIYDRFLTKAQRPPDPGDRWWGARNPCAAVLTWRLPAEGVAA
jgi:hypothetical protein